MLLPDIVAIKLGVYTLFCHQLLDHLPALDNATCADDKLTRDECCRRFNACLHAFFPEVSPRNLEQAADILGNDILSRAGHFQNRRAASIFNKIVKAAQAAAPTWDYRQDLETWHQQGKQLALCFYTESPWTVTHTRLDNKAELRFLFEEGAKVAFLEHCLGEELEPVLRDVITVRFTFSRDFDTYLAYPFLFMHEYAAHIFALDHGNELFNDGWLLHATDCFLNRCGLDLKVQPRLLSAQVQAFGSKECGRLRDISLRTTLFVCNFERWLRDDKLFSRMTWELAAFEPRASESPFWPNEFINRLKQAFEDNSSRSHLKRKIKSTSNLHELYGILP